MDVPPGSAVPHHQVPLHCLQTVGVDAVAGRVVPEQAGEAVRVEGAAAVGDGQEGTKVAMLGGSMAMQALQHAPLPGPVQRNGM